MSEPILTSAAATATATLSRRKGSLRLPWFVAGAGLPMLVLAVLGSGPAVVDVTRIGLSMADAHPLDALPLLFAADEQPIPGRFGDPAGVIPDTATTLDVQRGDTLERLFHRTGIAPADLSAIMELPVARDNLRILRPGDEIRVSHDNGELLSLSRAIDVFRSLTITRNGQSFTAELVDLPYTTRTTRSTGTITSSLFQAAASAGLSDSTIMNLATIFASEIDFVLDLREGDQFTVIYEEMWRDGEKLSDGEVLAAEFMTQGKVHRAVRFESSTGEIGYYTPEGQSLRRAWVRAPLAFSRVSSDFNPRRRHPILNTIRAHTGVDYAAPSGTPVRAPADGSVNFRGRKGGYGNAIILQHPGGITTLYAHLSGFGKAARLGARVKQGDVIGYVGATGLATAPHLHYEYRVNGRYMNPRTVKLPGGGVPLQASERPRFQRAALPLVKRLDAGRSLLAVNDVAARPSS
ncbi:MAG: M23 family metallopeptidase [Gammaproteobacteria bacterium]|nr:M23 family metallopeptidase [Gammaproteobacteria bacterium]